LSSPTRRSKLFPLNLPEKKKGGGVKRDRRGGKGEVENEVVATSCSSPNQKTNPGDRPLGETWVIARIGASIPAEKETLAKKRQRTMRGQGGVRGGFKSQLKTGGQMVEGETTLRYGATRGKKRAGVGIPR